MPQRKPYNPNTAYGRKKLREQARKEYEQLSPEEKTNRNILGIVILAIILLVVWLILGNEGFMKWMQR